MGFQTGDKVIPLRKTAGSKEFDNCASFYLRKELNQEYLYVNGIDQETTEKIGDTCYWCHAVQGAGDRYRESDLILYQG